MARLVDLEGCVLEEKKLFKSVASVGYESPKEIDAESAEKLETEKYQDRDRDIGPQVGNLG